MKKIIKNNISIIGLILMITVFGVSLGILFINAENKKDKELICEGEITSKHIDGAVATPYYIFTLNFTTDIKISEHVYYYFDVGDYIYYFASGRVSYTNI